MDLLLAERLVALAEPSTAPRSVLEIGVWKGGWLLQLLAAIPGVTGVGVDPYPGSPDLLERVLDRAQCKGVGDRLVMVASTSDACTRVCTDSHVTMTMTHIDGLHVEDQVTEDLRFAARHCTEDGLIIVDDYLYPGYPGIASALYRFLHEGEYAMFLSTGNKAYLCRAGMHECWHARAEGFLATSNLSWMRHSAEHSGPRYLQRPDVTGRHVLLCINRRNDEVALAGLKRPTRQAVREFGDRWVPVGCKDLIRLVRRRVRTQAHRSRRRPVAPS